ncbi:OLC1v1000989C1 [Oldenlandia corymbosa var. corymbosa]|uniref:OLC1v1000989C1 n=1 Tax=Oldenlandia corymbosa var. corymbosa TaxID=529605 RepID=A0AAV1D469_OLDCO|nr:OLC1v1000989C1 [Oldenlandia corymbosa var. corymbosa]
MELDSLKVVRRLESAGITSKQAEVIGTTIMEVIKDKDSESNLVSRDEEHLTSKVKDEFLKLCREAEKMTHDLEQEIERPSYTKDAQDRATNVETRNELYKQADALNNLDDKIDLSFLELEDKIDGEKSKLLKACLAVVANIGVRAIWIYWK